MKQMSNNLAFNIYHLYFPCTPCFGRALNQHSNVLRRARSPHHAACGKTPTCQSNHARSLSPSQARLMREYTFIFMVYIYVHVYIYTYTMIYIYIYTYIYIVWGGLFKIEIPYIQWQCSFCSPLKNQPRRSILRNFNVFFADHSGKAKRDVPPWKPASCRPPATG